MVHMEKDREILGKFTGKRIDVHYLAGEELKVEAYCKLVDVGETLIMVESSSKIDDVHPYYVFSIANVVMIKPAAASVPI